VAGAQSGAHTYRLAIIVVSLALTAAWVMILLVRS
jgi:hypothetical protein